MQRNNIIIFVIVAGAIIAGWYFLLFVPAEEERQKQHEARIAADLEKAKEQAKQLADAAKAKKDRQDAEPKKKVNEPEPKKKVEPEPKKKEEIKPQPKAETIALGGDGFHLSAALISRGAGVRQVTLNRFEAANWRGRPVYNAEGVAEKMQFVQDDEIRPSYRMYHYQDPKDENPVLGLGEEVWKVVKPAKEEKSDRDGGGSIVKRVDGKIVETDGDGKVVSESVRFSTMMPGTDIEIIKTYSLAPKDYHLGLVLEFYNRGTEKKQTDFRYQLVGAHGLPVEGEWYASITRNAFMAMVDPNNSVARGLQDAARISMRAGGDRFPEGSRDVYRIQYAGVANQFFAAMIVVDDKQPDKFAGGSTRDKIIAWTRPTLDSQETKGVVTQFLPKENKIHFTDDKGNPHFYHLLPRTKRHLEEDLGVHEGMKIVLSHYVTPDGRRIATWARLGDTPRPQFDDITMRVNSEIFSLYPGDKAVHHYMLYHGPVKVALLSQFKGDKAVPDELVNRYADDLHLATLTDYPSDNFLGKVSSFIHLTDVIIYVTRFMHWLLDKLHYVFGYGLSIVVLTIMVRGAMFPISRRQALFSIKMQELGPELKKIQDKYPDDPQAKMQATQEFYRKHGINPLGSCWPMLLQMPIFLGLYFAFQESIHFRLADFLWMENLAAPDMLFGWSDSLPYISDPNNLGGMLYLGPYLNILPMIAVVFMMIQQGQTMPPAADEQQAAQQKMMKYMTVFFGIMFYKVAAGLCIYFISSSLWGLAERKLLPKKKTGDQAITTDTATPSTAAATGGATPKWKGKQSRKEREKEKQKQQQKQQEPATGFAKLKEMWIEILKAAEKK
ncbi:MAG TPA: membrane protein insertase YidC [Gemmataceae bacterium]|nr:membrane protein insertase YidC [Gemmataceae bacterium]